MNYEVMTKIERFDLIDGGVYLSYHVHFNNSDYEHIINFDVYPIQDWTGPKGTKGISYFHRTKSDNVDEFKEGEVLKKMSGTYQWRGVWEGRLYFTDGEYWSEELMELANLFTVHIEPYCKAFLRKIEPNCNE